MSARKIGQFLQGPSAETALLAKARQLLRMQQVFIEITPPQLTKSSRLGPITNGTLIVFADNGAIAAKLKQLVPALLVKFQARDCEVTGIRVEVQPKTHKQKMVIDSKAWDGLGPAGLESLAKLFAKLAQSPLKSALQALLDQQTSRKRKPPER